MFASESPSNPKPHSQISSQQHNTNRLQFFSTLFAINQVTYLDPDRNFCIIQTKKYLSIKEELRNSLIHQQNLEKYNYEKNLENIAANRQLSIYKDELQKMNKNQQILVNQYQKICEQCKQYEQKYLQIHLNFTKNLQDQSLYGAKQNKRTQFKVKRSLQTQSCQTEYLGIRQEQITSNRNYEDTKIIPQVEITQQKLYQLLQSQMTKFQHQFQLKIRALEQAKLCIEKWQAENQLLREENQQMKQKIIDRNIEEEKLQIWKQNVHKFVSRIQTSIVQPNTKIYQQMSSHQSSDQVYWLKEEVLQLRGKLIEMRSKVRRIEDIMEGEAEINDDGAIGMLVRLSQKVRGIVKGMIMEVQQI